MAARPRGVFVSHIHEEAAVASVIREWINDAFRGHGVTAFVSSDRDDLPAGRKWLDVVREKLDACEVLVAVLSPAALQRPWVNIELGAAWIRGITVIPFCHSGNRAEQLDRPFQDFQGVDIDNPDPGWDLLAGVADALKLQHPARLDFATFKAELLAAAASVRGSADEPASVRPPDAQELSDEEVKILQALAAHANRTSSYNDEAVHIDLLPALSGVRPARLKFFLDRLKERDFVHVSYYSGGPDVRLLADGAGWLERKRLMPDG